MGGGGGPGGGGGGGTGIFPFTLYALDAALCGRDNKHTLSNDKNDIKTPACKRPPSFHWPLRLAEVCGELCHHQTGQI